MKTQVNNQLKISLIILTFNSTDYIDKCLKSVEKQLNKNIEVIVVDNNSSDATLLKLKKYKNIKIIKNKKNYGFSKGINIGIKNAKYKNILLLNPDTILFRNSIKNLLDCHKNTGAEIVGGKTKKKDGSLHGSYVKIPNIFTILFDYTNLRKLIPNDYFHKKHYYLNEIKPKKNKIVDVVSGAYMFISKKALKKVGFFDENFFMYLEDVDYCLRAKKKKIKVVYCPNASAFHFGGGSSNNKDRINYQAWYNSRSYYINKNFKKIVNIFLQPILFLDKQLIEIYKIIK